MSLHTQSRPTLLALRVVAVYALTYAGVYSFLWVPWGEVTLGWDMLTQYWPDTAFQARWIGSGDFPLWNPYERLGYPAYADPQTGQFYPVNWLLYPLGWVSGWMPYWGPLLKNWLHLIIASVGMFTLLRRRGEVAAACWAGGFIYAFSTPMADWTASALLWPSAWLPWVLLVVQRVFDRPTLHRGVQAGAIGALPVLAGNPPALFYSLISTLFFGAYLAIAHGRRAAKRWHYAGRVALALVAATATTLCVGAPALLPVQELYEHSVRTQRGAAFVLNTNLNVEGLWAFLLPNLGPRFYLHFGVITLFFAALALWKAPRRFVWAAALTLFGALVAIGGHGFLLRPLAEVLPPFGLFRGPHRYSVICAAGLAIWAPAGITILARMRLTGRRRVALALAAVGVLLAAASGAAAAGWLPSGGAVGRLVRNHNVAFGAVLAGTCVLVAVLVWLQSGSRARWWPGLVVVSTVLALWLGSHHRITKGNIFPRPDLRRDEAFAKLSHDADSGRIYDDRHLLYRPGSRLNLKDASGYEGDPLGSMRYNDVMRRVQRRPELLRHLGVVYYLRGGAHPRLGRRLRSAGRRPHFSRTRAAGVFRLDKPAPLAYVVPRPTLVDTPQQARDRWLAGPIGATAVVARADLPLYQPLERLAQQPAGPAVAGKLRQQGPDEVVARVDSPAGGLAVLLEAWYPGWEAYVDGRPAPVYRVNYLFRGVVVPPGPHSIRMVFRPSRFTQSAGLFLFGLLGLCGLQFRRVRQLLRLA